MNDFLNSNFFTAFVALLVGSVAYRVYIKQRRDAKRDAANIVLLEIENAERQLEKVNADRVFPGIDEDDVYLMRSASWDKYKYLFVRDLDRNEWDKLTSFYDKCSIYDKAAASYRRSREKNQQEARVNVHRILADLAKDYADISSDLSKEEINQRTSLYAEKRKAYISLMVGETSEILTYIPQQLDFEGKRVLTTIETNLTSTSIGIKLKLIVNKKGIFDRLANVFRSNSH